TRATRQFVQNSSKVLVFLETSRPLRLSAKTFLDILAEARTIELVRATMSETPCLTPLNLLSTGEAGGTAVTPSAVEPARRTPLYDWHVAHGARMVDFAGWDMPVQYSSITEEHQALRTAAGLFDISHMGRLSFAGPDALDLIQHVFTNNAATVKDFQARYGLVCNAQGGIRDDVLVYRWPYGWAMVVNASNRTKIVSWLAEQRGP